MTWSPGGYDRRRSAWYRDRAKVSVVVEPVRASGSAEDKDIKGTGVEFMGYLDPFGHRHATRIPPSEDPTLIVRAARLLRSDPKYRDFPHPAFKSRELVAEQLVDFLARIHPTALRLPPVALLVDVPGRIPWDAPMIDDPVRALTLLCRSSGRLFLAGRPPHIGNLISQTRPLAVYGIAVDGGAGR